MTDATERFIEAAVSPLADNEEMQIAVRGQLKEQISRAKEAKGDSLETAAARLESYESKPWQKYWRITLYTICCIVSVLVFGDLILSGFRFSRLMSFTLVGGTPYPFPLFEKFVEDKSFSALTSEQKLLLFGDTRSRGSAAQFKALWDTEPDNSAYFAVYTAACVHRDHALPPDFLDTARRLDPDNAFFPLMQVTLVAESAIDSLSSKTEKSPKGLKINRILNQGKLDEVISLVHQAAKLGRYENYQTEMIGKRIPLLPKQVDVFSQMIAPCYIGSLDSPNLGISRLAQAVSVKSIQLAKNKDPEAFKSLLMDWESVSNTFLRSNYFSLLDPVMAKSLITRPLKPMLEAATDLGLAEEAQRLKSLDDRFEQRSKQLKINPDPNADLVLRGSYMMAFGGFSSSRILLKPQKLWDEELEPGRMADHVLAERVMALMGALLLCHVASGSSLHRYWGNKLSRRLSGQLVNLLLPVDWLWIMGGGVLAPILWYGFITRFTPLSGSEWSLMASRFIVPGGQFMCMLCLLILLPVLLCRWRIKLRTGAVGLAGGKQHLGWVMALFGALALPLFALTFQGDQLQKGMLIVVLCFLGALVSYLLLVGMRALLVRGRLPIRRHTMARALFPAYVLGILAMAGMALFFYSEERHWVARDRLMEVSTDEPSMTRYEYQMTQALRKELLEMMSEKP